VDHKAPIMDLKQEVCNLLNLLRCKRVEELEKKQQLSNLACMADL
jgi:hypothetical protein